jgi:hypothetical protein
MPGDCDPALAEPAHGHLTVSCRTAGCQSHWYKLPCDPASRPRSLVGPA